MSVNLGIVVPTRSDAGHAVRLIAELVGDGLSESGPTTVVVVDNGLNEAGLESLPPGVVAISEPTPGAAYAMSTGCRYLIDRWAASAHLNDSWILVLDADCSVTSEFIPNWLENLAAPGPDIRCGALRFESLPGEPTLPPEVDAAWAWMWKYARWLERFAGVTNTATNHAARASLSNSLGHYVQPTEITASGVEVPVAGTDWDFGLRARLAGATVSRKGPPCRTSVRRIADDPAGFLTGRAYESQFRQASGSLVAEWPPAEDWPAILEFALARFTAHYLVKPLLVGLPADDTLRWFLGESLWDELIRTTRQFETPHNLNTDWVPYRRSLVRTLFEPSVFDLCGRLARRLQGSRS